jgi:hypothetical protein
MIVAGWMRLRRLFRRTLKWESRTRTHSLRRVKRIPGVEPLESMALLSTGIHMISGAAAHVDHLSNRRPVYHVTEPRVSYTNVMTSAQAPVSSPVQTVSIGETLTNFTNEPLAPNVNLFNPSLGTLLSVSVSHSASIQSNITSQNLSSSSPTVITAALSGSFQIDGLNQPISQPTTAISSQPMPAGVFGSGTDTVTFPPIVIPNSATTTFTDPASLAFFTSSADRSTVTLTMNATAAASASAPNGNLLTTTDTSAMATVTVTYTYLPATTPCPTVVGLGRIGVHHQRTKLVVSFDGTVDPTKAENPSDYSVITPSGKTIPIKSASFDPATNSVTLITARRLNVHHDFRLSLEIPCPNEQSSETVVIPFGSKRSLIGFHNHRGEFVSVKNGRIDGFFNYKDQFIPVHNGKIVRLKG